MNIFIRMLLLTLKLMMVARRKNVNLNCTRDRKGDATVFKLVYRILTGKITS